MLDRRSPEAALYRSWYKTARWRRIRADQLTAYPLCATCEKAGRITPATVCDHVDPHRWDEQRFWVGPFQSLCDTDPWRCHSMVKQREERRGFRREVDVDGWPTDPRHRAIRFDRG